MLQNSRHTSFNKVDLQEGNPYLLNESRVFIFIFLLEYPPATHSNMLSTSNSISLNEKQENSFGKICI
jgi:hypothetical protein